MGNTNSMVSVMFEEIKSLIKSIEKKLDEKAAVKETPPAPETITESQPDMIKPEQLIRVIAIHLQNTEQKIGQVSETVRESEKHIFFRLEELKHITISQKPDSTVRHHHIIDLRSSKVVVSIVSLSVLLLTSLFGNIHQFEVNSQMEDNNLKYRYIKSTNGISPENLDKLENIFHYHRNIRKIKEIKDRVVESEKTK